MNVDFETQHKYFLEYKIDSVELGAMCNDFPALQNAWDRFKTVYELCKEETHEDHTTIP